MLWPASDSLELPRGIPESARRRRGNGGWENTRFSACAPVLVRTHVESGDISLLLTTTCDLIRVLLFSLDIHLSSLLRVLVKFASEFLGWQNEQCRKTAGEVCVCVRDREGEREKERVCAGQGGNLCVSEAGNHQWLWSRWTQHTHTPVYSLGHHRSWSVGPISFPSACIYILTPLSSQKGTGDGREMVRKRDAPEV